MAIAIDQLAIGGLTNTAGPFSFNTSAAVASSGFIVVAVDWYSAAATLTSVSGGGLTWTIDKQALQTGGDTDHNLAIVSAQAPSGLASSTALTFNFSGTPDLLTGHGSSFTGVETSSPVDGTPTGPTVDDLSWATASYAIAAGSVIVALAEATVDDIATVTSPSVLLWNHFLGSTGITAGYRIETSAGSYTVAGTFASATATYNIAVAYKVAGATTQTLRPDADTTTTGWTSTPLWSKIEEVSADGTVITATAT